MYRDTRVTAIFLQKILKTSFTSHKGVQRGAELRFLTPQPDISLR